MEWVLGLQSFDNPPEYTEKTGEAQEVGAAVEMDPQQVDSLVTVDGSENGEPHQIQQRILMREAFCFSMLTDF